MSFGGEVMNILSNKKFWCIMGMFLYVSYVFRINVVFKYENIFAGVKFVGDPIFMLEYCFCLVLYCFICLWIRKNM